MQAHQELEQKLDAVKEVPKESPPFDLLYQAAIKQNSLQIENILEGFSINFGGLKDSPITKLASENNQTAINYLIEKFQASVKIAIFGYAKGGHLEAAHTLENTASPFNQQFFEEAKIAGLAAGGHILEVNNMLAAAPTEAKKSNLINSAIIGYGWAGNCKEAQKLLQNIHKNNLTSVKELLVQGLSESGFISAAKEILASVSSEELSDLQQTLIRGCGYSNHIEEGKKLIHDFDTKDLFEDLIIGLGIGGHFIPASFLIEENLPMKLHLLHGAAIGGYVAQALSIINAIDDTTKKFRIINDMLYRLAYFDHIAKACELLTLSDLKYNQCFDRLKKLIRGLATSNGEEYKNYLAQAQTEQNRITLLIEYAKACGEEGCVEKTNNTLQELPEDEQHDLKLELIGIYIKNGYFETANNLLTTAGNPAHRSEYLEKLVITYVEYDCITEAEAIFDQHAHEVNRFECLQELVKKLAENNKVAENEVNTFINKAESALQRITLIKLTINEYLSKDLYKAIHDLISTAETFNLVADLIAYTLDLVQHSKPLTWHIKIAVLKRLIQFEDPKILHEFVLGYKAIRKNFEYDLLELEQQAYVLQKLKKDFPFQNFKTLIPRSAKMLEVLKNHNLTYEQALAWTDKDAPILEWLLQPGYKKKLGNQGTLDILLKIATFLTPKLDLHQAYDLSNRAGLHFFKERMLNRLSEQDYLLTPKNHFVPAPNPNKHQKI